jgi:hypothetical protein
VWKREVDGLVLTFHLAGINNQNFLMRDDETGTYWQQISGAAIAGPLRGRQLELVHSDELTVALWKQEQPQGTVLKQDAPFAGKYAKKDWESKMQSTPTVLSYAQQGLAPRTLVVGLRANGQARAYPHETLVKEQLVQDRLGGLPVIFVLGPDGQSLRAFQAGEREFYRTPDGQLIDDATGTRWNFQGCPIASQSPCLQRLDIVQDYWFDWRHYNSATSVFTNAKHP